MRMHAPCDPDCPEYSALVKAVTEDPMTQHYGMAGEVLEDLGPRHQRGCERCREFGLANIEAA